MLFHVLTFAKPSCIDNVLQPSPLRGSGYNTLSHMGFIWQTLIYMRLNNKWELNLIFFLL